MAYTFCGSKARVYKLAFLYLSNQKQTVMKPINFEEITLRKQISSRGGGIEIDLSGFGKKYLGHKMTAYQNYLGGGMLGRICNDCTVLRWENDKKLKQVAELLKRYFHSLTNPDESEWESVTYLQNQTMPVSGF